MVTRLPLASVPVTHTNVGDAVVGVVLVVVVVVAGSAANAIATIMNK